MPANDWIVRIVWLVGNENSIAPVLMIALAMRPNDR